MKKYERFGYLREELTRNPSKKSHLISTETVRAILNMEDDYNHMGEVWNTDRDEMLQVKHDLKKAQTENRQLKKWKEDRIQRRSVHGFKTKQAILMDQVEDDVRLERHRQNELYPDSAENMMEFLTLAAEELGEVAQAILAHSQSAWSKPTDKQDLYTEWIHLSAISKRAAEKLRGELNHGEVDAGRESENEGVDI